MQLNEKQELVLLAYERTFDLKLAYDKAGVTLEEAEILKQDADFNTRIAMMSIEVKEQLFSSLLSLSDSDNESIKLKATLELVQILYPERFGKNSNADLDNSQYRDIKMPSNGRD